MRVTNIGNNEKIRKGAVQKLDEQILEGAPFGAVGYALYDYGESAHGVYLNCENQFFDEDENAWVDVGLFDNYFHSIRRMHDIKTIVDYEKWIKAISEHSKIPDFIKQSARSLLAINTTKYIHVM